MANNYSVDIFNITWWSYKKGKFAEFQIQGGGLEQNFS